MPNRLIAALLALLVCLPASADTTTYSPATTPIVASDWTDLGTGPLLVENHGSQPFMLREAAAKPSAGAIGQDVVSGEQRAFYAADHIWARATVDGSSPTANVTPIALGGTRKLTMTATIPSGQTSSGAIDLGSARLWAIRTPATLTATALTFTASEDCQAYSALYDSSGTAISWTVAASRYVVNAAPAQWLSVRCFKLVIGSSEGADRSFVIEAVP
jgi:hypothetical protein